MENIENQNQNINQEPNVGTGDETKNNDALFEKLNEIVDKRTAGIVKSILKENGVEDDEIKNVLNDYRQYKAKKVQTTATEIEELRRQNNDLNQRIKTGEKNAIIAKAASELGISNENLQYVRKLADLSNIEKDGHFDEEAIKSALQAVLNDVPAFKTAAQTEQDAGGFVKVGGQKKEQTKDDLEVNKIRRLMNLPELKN